jgi:hypothetical protein
MMPFLVDIFFLGVFLVVGTILIILLKAAIYFLPAIVLAVVVWYLTGSLTLGGLAFAVVAVLCMLKKK